jgi:HD-GYP domain-containing protein (c-di-GMP phosphodiesterase class II)
MAELHRCAGSQFDPEIVAAFEAVLEQPAPAQRPAPAQPEVLINA